MPEEIGNLDTSFFTADLLVVVLILAAILIYVYTAGKEHGVTMLISLYMAAFPFFFVPGIFNSLPNFGLEDHVAKIIVFVILFLITFWILCRNGFFESPMVPSKWEIGVFGVLFTGFALAIVGSFLSMEVSSSFSTIIKSVFYGDAILAFWAFAPVGFWILIKGE